MVLNFAEYCTLTVFIYITGNQSTLTLVLIFVWQIIKGCLVLLFVSNYFSNRNHIAA